MVGERSLGILVLATVLAGCSGEPSDRSAPPADGDPIATEGLDPVAARFTVPLRAGGTVDLAALLWDPPAANGTAVLLVHGFGGVKENYYHTLPERGVDIGGRLARTGRSAVALDLPGYGDSGGLRTDADIEAGSLLDDYAFVLDQVAQALRSGSYDVDDGQARAHARVVGLGISMGGYLVDITQGLHASFDAIVPVSASHRGLRSDAAVCFGQPVPPPGCAGFTPPRDDFVLENADPEVVNATIGGYEPMHVASLLSIASWAGTCGNSLPVPAPTCPTTRLDLNARSIDVPVLSVLATDDHLVDTSRSADEPASFPSSPAAQVLVLEQTGHMALHHLNHGEAMASIATWLAGQGV